MAYVRLFLYALSLQTVGCIAGFYSSRNLRSALTEEDSLIENLSALFFLIGGICGCLCYRRCTGHRAAFLLLITLGFLGFLDELSFGERLFGYNAPTIAGVKVDGVHDLVRIPLRPTRQWILTSPSGFLSMVAITFTAATILSVIVFICREKLRKWLRLSMTCPSFAAWSIFAGLLMIAILLDERLIRLDVLAILEELLEMNAALALILVAVCTARLKTPRVETEQSTSGNARNAARELASVE